MDPENDMMVDVQYNTFCQDLCSNMVCAEGELCDEMQCRSKCGIALDDKLGAYGGWELWDYSSSSSSSSSSSDSSEEFGDFHHHHGRHGHHGKGAKGPKGRRFGKGAKGAKGAKGKGRFHVRPEFRK